MGLFDDVKETAIKDAKSGKRYREKSPKEMTDRELDREILGSKSIVAKQKYAKEKLRRRNK